MIFVLFFVYGGGAIAAPAIFQINLAYHAAGVLNVYRTYLGPTVTAPIITPHAAAASGRTPEVAIVGVRVVVGAAVAPRLLIYASELAAYTALLGAVVALRLTLVPEPVVVAAALAATAARAAAAGIRGAAALPSLVASFTTVKIEAVVGPANPLFLGDFYRVDSHLV